MKTDTTFETMRPLTCDSAETFCHSGSAWNAAQLALAASRSLCEMM